MNTKTKISESWNYQKELLDQYLLCFHTENLQNRVKSWGPLYDDHAAFGAWERKGCGNPKQKIHVPTWLTILVFTDGSPVRYTRRKVFEEAKKCFQAIICENTSSLIIHTKGYWWREKILLPYPREDGEVITNIGPASKWVWQPRVTQEILTHSRADNRRKQQDT